MVEAGASSKPVEAGEKTVRSRDLQGVAQSNASANASNGTKDASNATVIDEAMVSLS